MFLKSLSHRRLTAFTFTLPSRSLSSALTTSTCLRGTSKVPRARHGSPTAPSPSFKALLDLAAKQTGLTPPQLTSLQHLISLLIQSNRHYNLTAIRTPDAILLKHILDALTILPHLDPHSPSSLIDIGSGAGFPGIVLAVARPDLKVTLLDSSRKKTEFHSLIRESLPLPNICSLWARAEKAAQEPAFRESFDIVVARSVAEMPVLAELCLPFVNIDGYFFAQKSLDRTHSEIRRAANALDILGGRVESVTPAWPPEWSAAASQPDKDQHDREKCIVTVRKCCHTPSKYPRLPGLPKKAPL